MKARYTWLPIEETDFSTFTDEELVKAAHDSYAFALEALYSRGLDKEGDEVYPHRHFYSAKIINLIRFGKTPKHDVAISDGRQSVIVYPLRDQLNATYGVGKYGEDPIEGGFPTLLAAWERLGEFYGESPKIWVIAPVEQLPRSLNEAFQSGAIEDATTKEIAAWFVNLAANLDTHGKAMAIEHPTWAPAAEQSFALHPIAGDLEGLKFLRTADDGWHDNWYNWYELSWVDPNEIIWRISCFGTLYVFRKNEGETETWTARRVENVGDLYALAYNVLNRSGLFTRDTCEDMVRSIVWDLSHTTAQPHQVTLSIIDYINEFIR